MPVGKSLKDLSLDELWKLFPIAIVPHNPQWKLWAEEEIAVLSEIIADYSPMINHVGSTAIPTICAKPTIDILVEINPESDWGMVKNRMEAHGYICMSTSEKRMSFNKGYTPDGYAERVFHIHFHANGDNDEIYFRNYLINNLTVAKDYEKLKLSLLPEYRNNRDGYTRAKTDFIKKIMKFAR